MRREANESYKNHGEHTHRTSNRGKQSECLVQDSMGFILMLSRATGVAPVYLQREGHLWRVGFSHGMRVYGCLVVPALVLTCYIGLAVDLAVGAERGIRAQSRLTYLVWAADVSCVSATALAGVWSGPQRVRQMIAAFNDMDKINRDLGIKWNGTDDRKRKIVVVCVLVFMTLLLTFDFKHITEEASNDGREWRINLIYLPFFIMYLFKFLLELQFILAVTHVNSSLRAINHALEEELNSLDTRTEYVDHPIKYINKLIDSMAVTETSKYTVKLSKSNNYSWLRHLARCHGCVSDATLALNDANGPILFFIVVNLLLHLINTPYYLITDILKFEGVKISFLFIQICWCIVHTTNMCAVIEPCHVTIVEMQSTRQIVSQLLRRADSPSDALHRQLALFAEQLMLSRAEYAPLGVTTLHRPLIATIPARPPLAPSFTRRRRPECVVQESMALVLMLGRAAGVAPVTLSREGRRWRVAYSRRMKVYGWVVVPALVILLRNPPLLPVLITYTGLLYDLSVGPSHGVRVQSNMSLVVWACDLSCIAAACLAGAATAPARVKQMLVVIREVDSINSALNSDLNERGERKKKALCVLIVAALLLLFVLDFRHMTEEAYNEGREWRISFFYLSFYCLYIIMFILELQFVLAVAHVNCALRAVNDALGRELRDMEYIECEI
ncbi:hypothetical protein JYU34_012262 [Plutella xylostella]|uniref:Gustatory receptor n=1 Tax=Plutella xylostella TaxID=51655 RepID=A0ABQ7QFZ7_PLUXY|nr:hypothetical protein JYU34_012262 [Plutella xylostella]